VVLDRRIDLDVRHRPPALEAIERDTAAHGFAMASEPRTGALLAALASMKPEGRLLELGTGTGIGTSWLLWGMDATARLDTVDTDAAVVAIAQRHLGSDPRVTFHLQDGAAFIGEAPADAYALIYADAWPGKFSHLDDVLSLLGPGGVYVIDDLLPQVTWPEGHAAKIAPLVDAIERRADVTTVRLAWSSGLLLAVRRG
jgi:predicted O-methyltransferase YrrM